MEPIKILTCQKSNKVILQRKIRDVTGIISTYGSKLVVCHD